MSAHQCIAIHPSSAAVSQEREPCRERAPWDRLLAFLSAIHCDEVGSAYERTRERLLRFFRVRGSTDAEELVDETFNRLERRVADGTPIRAPEKYLLGVARLVWAERVRQERSRRQCGFGLHASQAESGDDADRERNLTLLERCLAELPIEARDLLLHYYRGSGQERIRLRQALARDRGFSASHLRIRVHRLRSQIAARLAELALAPEHRCVVLKYEARRTAEGE
jgi:DNA-directed RNA polymerase specialized sigma24 family protein